jgi:hypothetical protein
MKKQDHEVYYLLECNAVSSDRSPPTFQRNVLSVSSGLKSKSNKNPARVKGKDIPVTGRGGP